MLKLVSKGLNVGAEVLRYQGLCFFTWAFWKSPPIRACWAFGLPVIPDHDGEVHVGDQYRRAGRGDNVSLYRATSHVPVIQRSVDVFVCNRLYHLASARFGLG